MMSASATPRRGFYRDADRAMLGGVCAGLAGSLGFNLRVTRILAFIALLMATPVAIVAYLAAVFLIPSVSDSGYDVSERNGFRGRRRSCKKRKSRKERRAEKDESKDTPRSNIATVIELRCQSMDERLVRLEKHVTSKRFQIDQELGRL